MPGLLGKIRSYYIYIASYIDDVNVKVLIQNESQSTEMQSLEVEKEKVSKQEKEKGWGTEDDGERRNGQ